MRRPTVGDLLDYLHQFDLDTPVILTPPENNVTDAIVLAWALDALEFTCPSCGREFTAGEYPELANTDTCPSDDCPSHEFAEEGEA